MASTHTVGFSVVDENGTRLSSMLAEELGGDGQLAEIEILRGDLSQVFYDATQGDVEYLFGDRITDLADRHDEVRVDSPVVRSAGSTW